MCLVQWVKIGPTKACPCEISELWGQGEDSTSLNKGKKNIYQVSRIRMASDFSSLEVSQQHWKVECYNNIFKTLKENCFQAKIIYLATLSIKRQVE